MSADNIILVGKQKGKWTVWYQSASMDHKTGNAFRPPTKHKTKSKALLTAAKLQKDIGNVEYGINVV